MNFSAIIIGLLLMFTGFFFTIVTFGFGVICTWPIILIGMILFIMGLMIPYKKTNIIYHDNSIYNDERSTKRVCTKCGRAIINDAKFCPYCGNKFIEY